MCSKFVEENYDVVVVGAGHAGCEAALACARLGLETIVFTVSVDSIALMPCNPNIGGSSTTGCSRRRRGWDRSFWCRCTFMWTPAEPG